MISTPVYVLKCLLTYIIIISYCAVNTFRNINTWIYITVHDIVFLRILLQWTRNGTVFPQLNSVMSLTLTAKASGMMICAISLQYYFYALYTRLYIYIIYRSIFVFWYCANCIVSQVDGAINSNRKMQYEKCCYD